MVWGLADFRVVRVSGRRQRRQDQPGRRDRPHLVSGDPQPSRPRGARARPPAAAGMGLLRERRRRRTLPAPQLRCVRASSRCTTACSSMSRTATSRRRCSASAIAMPMLVAPTAFHKLAHKDGELATRARRRRRRHDVHPVDAVEHARSRTSSRAATRPGVVPALRLQGSRRDRGAGPARRGGGLQRARAHRRCAAARPPRARRPQPVRAAARARRSRTCTPPATRPSPRPPAESGLAAYFAELLDPALTWEAIELAALDHEAAGAREGHRARRRCRARGRGTAPRAIVVSNHGGRQLDASPATIEVLAARASMPSPGAARCCSTAACGAATDVDQGDRARRACGARRPAGAVGPRRGGSRRRGRRARRAAPRARSRDGAVRMPGRREHHARPGARRDRTHRRHDRDRRSSRSRSACVVTRKRPMSAERPRMLAAAAEEARAASAAG